MEDNEVSARQLETQEGIKVAQGIVDREKHEDNEVVPKRRRKVQVIV